MLRHTAALLAISVLPFMSAHALPASDPFIPELDVPMSMLDNPSDLLSVSDTLGGSVSTTDVIADVPAPEHEHTLPAGTDVVTTSTTEVISAESYSVGAAGEGQTSVSETLTITTTMSEGMVSGTAISATVVSATLVSEQSQDASPTSAAFPSEHEHHEAIPAMQVSTHHAPELKGENTASTRTYFKGLNEMHKGMDITYTGDADIDFLRGMIAHHVGAVDMAKTVMEYGQDNQVRRLAREIIRAQTLEINIMNKKLEQLVKRGPKISSDMPRSGVWTDESWVGEDYMAR